MFVAAKRNIAVSRSSQLPQFRSLLLMVQSTYSPRSAAVMAASISTVATEAMVGSCAGCMGCVGWYLMLPIQTEPSGLSFKRDDVVPELEVWMFKGGQACEVSQTAHCQAMASKVDCPSIFPPGEMQNSIECPLFCNWGICWPMAEKMPVRLLLGRTVRTGRWMWVSGGGYEQAP